MSNERNSLGQDPLVTETYKQLARERVPEHLNQKVLRLAAEGTRSPYARARAWMRPAAWAATIGLSFAIVLELTQLPQIEPESVDVITSDEDLSLNYRTNGAIDDAAKRSDSPAPVTEPGTSETTRQFAPKDMDVLREAEDRANLQAGPDQVPGAQAPVPRERVLQQPMALKTKLEDSTAEVDDVVLEEAVAEEAVAADSVQGFAASRSLATAVEKKDQSRSHACPAESRQTAESWYGCIKRLHEDGEEELADSEYEEFHRVFPDFVDLAADK